MLVVSPPQIDGTTYRFGPLVTELEAALIYDLETVLARGDG
jgi:hypothetical protein